MRKIKFFISLLFVLFTSIGQVWGAEEVAYTITYAKGTSDSATDAPSISAQKDGTGKTGNFATLSSSTAYKRTNGMHLSSGKNNGSATLTLLDDGKITATKVVTNALAKSDKTFTITITFSDNTTQTATFKPGTTTVDNTLTINSTNASKTLKTIAYTANSGSGVGIASTTVYKTGSEETTVSLDANGNGWDGEVKYAKGSADPAENPQWVKPYDNTGWVLIGYYTAASGGAKVISSNNTLVASVSGWTDASGKWTKTDAEATLYAQWRTSELGAIDHTTVTNIEATSATLKWDAVTGADKYQVYVTYYNNDEPFEVNTNSAKLTGLTAETDYMWSVKALGNAANGYTDGPAYENGVFTTGEACASVITISKGAETNGTFTLGTIGEQCIDGGNASTTVTCTPAEHYHVKAVTSTGGGDVSGSENNWTVSNISATTTINVEFEEDAKCTVTFMNFGTEVSTKQVYANEVIGTLPAQGEMKPCSYNKESNTFLGWSKTLTGKTQTAPELVDENEVITEDVSLYAVWVKASAYKLVDELTSGKKYIFVSSNTAGDAKAIDAKNLATTASNASAANVTITKVGSDMVVSPYNTDLEFELTNDDPAQLAIVCSLTGEKLVVNGNGLGKVTSNFKSFWSTDYGLYGTNSRGTSNYYVYYDDEQVKMFKDATSTNNGRVYAYERSESAYSDFLSSCETPTKCDAPTFTGTPAFIGSTDVTITTSTDGASIYYTLDGSDPTTSDTKVEYAGAITLTETTTVKAIAMKEGLTSSEVATQEFVKATLSSLTITAQPTKKTYNSDEDFDATGMKVTATYSNDGTVENYANYTIVNGTNLATGTTELTIKSNEDETKTATISGIKVNAKLTWKVSGSEDITTYAASDKVVLPTENPTEWACIGRYPYFRGWVAEEINGVVTSEPTYVKATDAATADKTYYAVFAAGMVGEATNASTTLSFDEAEPGQNFKTSDGASWTYKATNINWNTGSHGFAASGSGWVQVELPVGTVEATSVVINWYSQWGNSANLILSANGIDGALNTFTKNSFSSNTASYDFTATNKNAGTYKLTQSGSQGAWVSSIVINYLKRNTNYTEWVTTCCTQLEAPQNVEVANITKNSASVTWSNVEHATGYEYTIDGGANWAAATSPLALSELVAGTAYTVSVRATDNTGTYCAAGAAASKNFTTKYTISIAEGIANGSIAAATEAAAGEAVEVTVSPATNYDLYQFTVNGEVTILTEGKFTMPAANVTLGATFRSENHHTITFVKNRESATGEMPIQDFEYPNEVTLTANAFELAAAEFKGWATSETGKKVYDDGATVTDFSNENQVLYAVWDIAYDHYYDRVHGHEFDAQTGVYTRPNLENETEVAGSCAGTHYVFKGWVEAEHAAAPTDADLIAGAEENVTASGTTYYAVWAEKKNVPTQKKMICDFEGTFDANTWYKANNLNVRTNGTSQANIKSKTGDKYAEYTGTQADLIHTKSKITNPSSITCYVAKGSTNAERSATFSVGVCSTVNGTYTTVATSADLKSKTKGEWVELSADLSAYNDVYVRISLTDEGSIVRAIDDITITYIEEELSDVDYITECTTRYELTFDNNEGKGLAYEAVRLKKDGTIALPDGSQLSKNMCDFTGWNTTAAGDGTHYDAGDTYTMAEEDVTLYAEWTPWTLKSISLTTTGVQTKFYEGDLFNTDNLVVKANYVDGASANHSVEVDGWTTNYDAYRTVAFGSEVEAGKQNVTVSYEKKSNVYEIDIEKFALPYAYNDNGTNLPTWFEKNNIGDYNSDNTQIRFPVSGNDNSSLILKYPGGASELTFQAKLNGSWSNDNEFVVSTSEDGTDWTVQRTFTGSEDKLTGSETEYTVRIPKSAKYIKWEYSKSSGNVGLGDIHLYDVYYEEKTLDMVATDGGKYYATFSNMEDDCFFPSDQAKVMTINLSRYQIARNLLTVDEAKLSLTSNDMTDGYYVPKNNGVLIESDNSAVTYYVIAGGKDGLTDLTDNYLMPGTEADEIAGWDYSHYYYKLAYDDFEKKSGLGFYWGAAGGTGAFKVKKGLAYLVAEKVNDSGYAPSRFLLNDPSQLPTDVQRTEESETAVKFVREGRFFILRAGRIYDLNGQLVK